MLPCVFNVIYQVLWSHMITMWEKITLLLKVHHLTYRIFKYWHLHYDKFPSHKVIIWLQKTCALIQVIWATVTVLLCYFFPAWQPLVTIHFHCMEKISMLPLVICKRAFFPAYERQRSSGESGETLPQSAQSDAIVKRRLLYICHKAIDDNCFWLC